MAYSNRGVRGPKSLRINGQKISELPLGMGEAAKEQLPMMIDQERKNRVNSIIARFPRGTLEQYNARISECERNIKLFGDERTKTRTKMQEYQLLMRNNDGRDRAEVEAEVQQLVIDSGKPQPGTPEFEDLRAKIRDLDATIQPYDGPALWQQVKQFQDDVERYEVAVEKERAAMGDMKLAIKMIGQRDREITAAMSEVIEVG
jgi:chromosome segregation ATPase